MKVTFSINGETVERVREIARQQGTSLDALVRRYLESLAGTQRGERLAEQFDELWRERSGRSGGWRFDREDLYQ